MKKTMMYLPDEMHRFLAEEAERRGASMAEIAREAISEYRASREAEDKVDPSTFVGLIDTGAAQTNDSERVDELLAAHFAAGGAWDEEHGARGGS